MADRALEILDKRVTAQRPGWSAEVKHLDDDDRGLRICARHAAAPVV